jgi:uncharacterized membrane protein YfcA
MITMILVLFVMGIIVGLMSAMFGIGGGVVMVPFIVLVMDGSQHLAEGTSLAVMVPTAVAGVLAHRKRGFVRFDSAAWIGAPGVLGAVVGALLAHRLDADTLQIYFGAFTVLVGLKVLRDGATRRWGRR